MPFTTEISNIKSEINSGLSASQYSAKDLVYVSKAIEALANAEGSGGNFDELTVNTILYVGANANNFEDTGGLTNPIAVFSKAGTASSFAQIAFRNETATSSTDIIAYMNNGDDTEGWVGMGIAGSAFDDTTYGITGPGDGYIFHNTKSGAGRDGNLVIATGNAGDENKIVIAAGGFASGNTQMVINPAGTGNVHIETPTASTSPSTGALTVVGGVGINGDVNIAGNITFGGSGTTLETTTLAVSDPLIFVGSGNTTDAVDLGLVAEYGTALASTLTNTVTNKALTSNVATLTTGTAHSLAIGDIVVVGGVDSVFNGTHVVASVPTTTTFTFAKTNANVTSAAVSPVGTTSASTKRRFAGVVRDASDGVLKAFKDATTKPTSTINFAESGLTYGDLQVAGLTASSATFTSATIGSVTNTEIGYLSGVTSGIQAQLNAKATAATIASTYAPLASPTITGNATFSASSGVPVKITNTGTGDSFVVEDDASTDTTPFVVSASGNVGIGVASPGQKLDVRGGRGIFINAEAYIIGMQRTTSDNGIWMGSHEADGMQWSTWGGANLMRLSGVTNNYRLQLASGTTLEAPLTTRTVSGTSDTLVLADAGKLIECSNGAATTVTVPTNSAHSYPVGTQINILQVGAGQVTVAGAGGVTVNATPGLKLRAQWSSATLIKRGTDTWVLVGDLVA